MALLTFCSAAFSVAAQGEVAKGSKIVIKTDGSVSATDGSGVNTGVSLDGVKMDSAVIDVQTKGDVTAKKGSEVNIGADLKNAELEKGSSVKVRNEAKIDADSSSRVITGAEVKDVKGKVTVDKETKGEIKAKGGETVKPKDDESFKIEIPKF